MHPLRIVDEFAEPGGEDVQVVRDEEAVLAVLQDGGGGGAFHHDGRRVQRRGLADHERRVVVQRREQEEVRRRVILDDIGPFREHAHKGDLAVQALLGDEVLHRIGRIAGAHEVHPERDVLDLLQGVDDEAGVLLPDVLAHEQEHELVRADAEVLARIGEEGLGIVGDEVAAVVHDLHGALEAILPDHLLHGGLRDPDLVGPVIKVDDALDDPVHDELRLDHAGEVVAVLGVEGRHHRDVAELGDVRRRQARREGAVRMDNLEGAVHDLLQEGRVDLREARHVGLAERDRDGEVRKHLVFMDAVVRARDIGGDDGHAAHLFLHPVRIVLDANSHPVHHGREAVVEKTDIRFHSLSQARRLTALPASW